LVSNEEYKESNCYYILHGCYKVLVREKDHNGKYGTLPSDILILIFCYQMHFLTKIINIMGYNYFCTQYFQFNVSKLSVNINTIFYKSAHFYLSAEFIFQTLIFSIIFSNFPYYSLMLYKLKAVRTVVKLNCVILRAHIVRADIVWTDIVRADIVWTDIVRAHLLYGLTVDCANTLLSTIII